MISIVIPTLNEEAYLPKLLKSIKEQSFKDYEIIVADAGSTDNTKKIARQYGATVVKGGLPGVGRNNGAAAAKGDFLFFFDSDVKIPKHFLRKANDEMQDRYIDLATCEFRPLSNLHIDKVMHDFANISIKLSQFSVPHAPGFCIFVTRRLFERVGGFDTTIKLAEDHDFVKRASKYRPMRVLNNVRLQVSVRRLRKEGRFMLMGKYLGAEMLRMFKGELRDNTVKYEFGVFDKNDNTQLEKKLRRLETHINRLNRNYNQFSKKYLKHEKIGKKGQLGLRNLKSNLNKTLKELIDNLPR